MINLLKAVARDERRMRTLKIISSVSSYTLAAFFGCQLLVHLIDGLYVELIAAAVSASVGFVAVTVMRSRINARRPYEVYEFYETPPRALAGKSFPSRHSYSAFVIATLSWLISPLFFAGLMLIALAIAVCRTLTGIHFLRDVAVGGGIGVLHGAAAIIITYLV